MSHGVPKMIYFSGLTLEIYLKESVTIWITEKMQELEFERKIAKRSDIKALFDLELNQIVKMSELSEIYVNTKQVERQRVSTCLKVLCEPGEGGGGGVLSNMTSC